MKTIVGKFVIDNYEIDNKIINGIWINEENYKLREPLQQYDSYTRAVKYVREMDASENKRLHWLRDKQSIELLFDQGNDAMLKHFNNRQLFTILKKELGHMRERLAKNCDSWKDSGDRGACFAYEVSPIDNTMEEIENIQNKIKIENDGVGGFYKINF